jgi:hypothetical protein
MAVARKQIRPGVVAEMLQKGLQELTGQPDLAAAWHKLLRPDDVVGFKFDAYGEQQLRVGRPLGEALITTLFEAGWSKEQIRVMDAPQGLTESLGVQNHASRWAAKPIKLGTKPEYVSSFVDSVTALVNVPFLKNDSIFGISSSMKCMTYDFLKHPARYHANGGVPGLVDALAADQLGGKLRLNVVNGLRSVFKGGPLVSEDAIDDTGILIFSEDPVAADAVGLDTLNKVRAGYELPHVATDPADVPLLADAERRGLGHADFRHIDRRTIAVP